MVSPTTSVSNPSGRWDLAPLSTLRKHKWKSERFTGGYAMDHVSIQIAGAEDFLPLSALKHYKGGYKTERNAPFYATSTNGRQGRMAVQQTIRASNSIHHDPTVPYHCDQLGWSRLVSPIEATCFECNCSSALAIALLAQNQARPTLSVRIEFSQLAISSVLLSTFRISFELTDSPSS